MKPFEEDGTYDLGMLWDPNGHRDPLPDDASEEDRVRAWWAEGFCYQQQFLIKHPDTKDRRVYLPPLLNWYRYESLEVFEIELRGRLRKVLPHLTAALKTARYARQITVSNIDGDPGAVKVVLNHAQLPDLLEFDPGKVPDDPNLFYLGQLGCGPDALIDFTVTPHAIFAGGTGSGKTEGAALLLSQIHHKGGTLIIGTPTVGDVNLEMFGELLVDDDVELGIPRHTVVAGSDREALSALAKACGGLRGEISRREREMGEAGDHIYQGDWLWLVLDEIGWLIKPESPDDGLNEFRRIIFQAALLVAQRGRKVRVGLMAMTQQPYADELGGSLALMGQMYVRVAIRTLSAFFQDSMFNPDPSQKDTIRDTLSGSDSHPGRAISKGIQEPTDPWYQGFPVQNQPMQVAYATLLQRRAYLGLPDKPRKLTRREVADPEHAARSEVDRASEFGALGFDADGNPFDFHPETHEHPSDGFGIDMWETTDLEIPVEPDEVPVMEVRPRERRFPAGSLQRGRSSAGDDGTTVLVGGDEIDGEPAPLGVWRPEPVGGSHLRVVPDGVADRVTEPVSDFVPVQWRKLGPFDGPVMAAATVSVAIGWLFLLIFWPRLGWWERLMWVGWHQSVLVGARVWSAAARRRRMTGPLSRAVLVIVGCGCLLGQMSSSMVWSGVGFVFATGLFAQDMIREVAAYFPAAATPSTGASRSAVGLVVMAGVAALTLACAALLIGAGVGGGGWLP